MSENSTNGTITKRKALIAVFIAIFVTSFLTVALDKAEGAEPTGSWGIDW